MLLSDLEPLECILNNLVPEEEPSYINNNNSSNNEIDMVETCLQLMYEYINDNPTCISDPDFEEDMLSDVKELFTMHFEGDAFFNDDAEDEIDGIIDTAANIFYENFIPRRSQRSVCQNKLSTKEIKYLEKQIKELSEQEQPEQRTPEWYKFRHNLITASNAYKAFENQNTQNQLIYEKCQPLFIPENEMENDNIQKQQVNTNTTLHWGQKYEPVSVMIYEDKYKTKVGDFGCIQHNKYSFLGASPDGINIDKHSPRYGRMLEIKNIVNREINGNPKKEYWIQMQLQMETCDLNECDFLETKFVEYADWNEFEEDIDEEDENITLSRDGYQKGIIIHFHTNDGKPFYAYKPLDIISDIEIEEWEQNMIELYESDEYGYTFLKFIYWKLEEYSCVLVLRNKKWFEDNIEQLKNIWSIIEEERKSGHSHRAPNKRVKKESLDDEQSQVSSGCLLNVKNGKSILNIIKIRTESFDETKANLQIFDNMSDS
jgi:putative phage-type endonuclease